ncbi:hypothetical protein PHYPSEUDO_013483 [Phytophthora pseudosyringae]|uniref:RxLR effector protein n=1 Tax=Phytophthora pseudosyringae TaxID=221518 RepID=A0A8T1WIC2_9STRA|nr:hypothetical protein PHYPSEUDO_013483 [Phytophthora pseudosyringae]
MRLTESLLAIAVVLVASTDNLAAASTATTTAQDGLYAELYNVEAGVVTKKMRVPLGDIEQYTDSDFKQLKQTLTKTQEERAAVRLPRGFNTFFSGLERFVGMFKRSNRRLQSREA